MNKLNLLFLLITTIANAQIPEFNSAYKKETYYWFYVAQSSVQDKISETNRILVKEVGSNIYSGSFDEFVIDHDAALKSGQIAIGPFTERHHVQHAQWLYSNAGKSIASKNQKKDDEKEDTYSYFFIKPLPLNPQNELRFERTPSRLDSGTETEFMETMNEGLYFDRLLIGPFPNYGLAEKAKFVYRKNGEYGFGNTIDSVAGKNLKFMARKWKSLKLEITKQSDEKEIKKTIYRFTTRFPKNYFVPDAYQVITITASYNDSFETSSASFTLQGEDVADNNYVIDYLSGTIYINLLYFDDNSPAKINGFFFESFVYNDYEIIELETVYLPLK